MKDGSACATQPPEAFDPPKDSICFELQGHNKMSRFLFKLDLNVAKSFQANLRDTEGTEMTFGTYSASSFNVESFIYLQRHDGHTLVESIAKLKCLKVLMINNIVSK